MILVVDDEDAVRRALVRMLARHGYGCDTVSTVEEARHALRINHYELVLCDVMMPDEHGVALLRYVRAQFPWLPIVMVSGVTDPGFATIALGLGAYGYVTKPFEVNQVVIAVANALLRARVETENDTYRVQLEQMVVERTQALGETVHRLEDSETSLRRTSEDTIKALARAIEGRDFETGQHIERMSQYAELLGGLCGLGDEQCASIRLAAAMHDVGKVGVPDSILLKPGRVTPEEFDVIKQHAELGFEILDKSDQPLMVMAAVIAHTHHERWDGSGYPRGLAGEEIALEGRIAAVADVFDALVSRRVYKPALPVDEALDIMRSARATSFDPDVLDLFLDHAGEAVAVLEMFPDT
ncbi:MAG TPA: HD domain-containing phosphohydrolase [Acidimicrobiales bacterium]|nr:HD domain-containing phosphohydrolase [Acidimicrobiales bacterium]